MVAWQMTALVLRLFASCLPIGLPPGREAPLEVEFAESGIDIDTFKSVTSGGLMQIKHGPVPLVHGVATLL